MVGEQRTKQSLILNNIVCRGDHWSPFLYYENPQIVWGFSIALAMKNKTPFDIILLRLPEAIILYKRRIKRYEK